MRIPKLSRLTTHQKFVNHHSFSIYSTQQFQLATSDLISIPKPFSSTLDDPFIPDVSFSVSTIRNVIFVTIVAVMAALVRNYWRFEANNHVSSKPNKHPSQKKWFSKWWSIISKKVRRFSDKLMKSSSLAVNELETTQDDQMTEIEKHTKRQQTWKSCSLERKDILNDRFMFYKFKAGTPLDFGIGGTVLLCSTNEDDLPIKEEYYPTTIQIDNRQQFGIVTRIFKRSKDDRLSMLLPSLTYGDEVAYKPGKNVLEYIGYENPIRFLTIVASGTGIVPILEFLKRILSNDEFHIDRCELLWINDSKEDFIFNAEVEKLETEHNDRFFCARVLDQDITAENSLLNDKVRSSLPLAEPGRVAIIAAPSIVANKFKPALDSLIYTGENIMCIPV